MAKKISKILAIVGIVAVLLSVSAVAVSASDVAVNQGDNLGVYTTSIPLQAIEYHDIVGFGTTNTFSAVVDNPFILYNYGVDNVGDFRDGKMGVVLNYPYQSSNFTDSGRTIWYDFRLDSLRNLSIYQPMHYANGTSSRMPSNSRYTDYYFDDFVIREDTDTSFLLNYATNSIEYLENFEWSFEVVMINDNDTAYEYHQISGSSPFGYVVNFDMLLGFCSEQGVRILDDEMLIRNLKIRYVPFEYNLPDNNNQVLECTIQTQVRYLGSSSLDVDMWYYERPLRTWYVESIGDVELLDWLEVAVGGFLGAELIPNVSLGGLLLLGLSVGIVMLLIRIFRG